jgi:hypothetical protein
MGERQILPGTRRSRAGAVELISHDPILPDRAVPARGRGPRATGRPRDLNRCSPVDTAPRFLPPSLRTPSPQVRASCDQDRSSSSPTCPQPCAGVSTALPTVHPQSCPQPSLWLGARTSSVTRAPSDPRGRTGRGCAGVASGRSREAWRRGTVRERRRAPSP